MSEGRPLDPRAGEEVVEGVVDTVLFRSDDGRFCVIRVTPERDPTPIVAVGELGGVTVGETVRLRGRTSRHAVHGERFKVESFAPVLPTRREGIVRFLGSGLVEGIGPAIAERLVARFGERTFEVITEESGRLREVEGIGPQRARAIAEAVRARRAEAETLSFLQSLGLGPALARKIRERYGENAPSQLREDPYRVAGEVRGVGFKTADQIGLGAGLAKDDPRRAAGAILHMLGKGVEDRHVFLPRAALEESARAIEIPAPRVEEAIRTLALAQRVIVDGDAVYLPALHRAELAVARKLRALARPRAALHPARVDRALEAAQMSALSADQANAVRASFDSGLVVITGGPGTGKTTTVRSLVRAHVALGHRVCLAAPTGRAARRISETSGAPASTIHRLLEWNPHLGRFSRNAAVPIDAEVVLVDEASMLDLPLAESLLDAIADSSRLILVGDVDQLPPVGPGRVLGDLLDSERGRKVRLTQVFRQAEASDIVRGAHAILRGELPEATPAGTRTAGDLFIIRALDPEAIQARLVEAIRRIERSYGLDPRRDVQVLVPMHRGPVGTARLNELLQAELSQKAATAGPHPGAFLPSDKVMQLRNDYERDVFNGDIGEVRRVDAGIVYVDMDGREVAYGTDDLAELTLAYAATIHKAQGSEYPAVIVVLHGSHHMLLTRALLYTAVTRAKQLVVLLGDPRAMTRAAENATTDVRYGRLTERLREP